MYIYSMKLHVIATVHVHVHENCRKVIKYLYMLQFQVSFTLYYSTLLLLSLLHVFLKG